MGYNRVITLSDPSANFFSTANFPPTGKLPTHRQTSHPPANFPLTGKFFTIWGRSTWAQMNTPNYREFKTWRPSLYNPFQEFNHFLKPVLVAACGSLLTTSTGIHRERENIYTPLAFVLSVDQAPHYMLTITDLIEYAKLICYSDSECIHRPNISTSLRKQC